MNGQTTFPYRFQKEPVALGMEENGIKQYNLTKRETEIIQFLKNGFTNQQISATLYLSIYTVETHRKNIMQKLGLKKPIALMRFIIENKI